MMKLCKSCGTEQPLAGFYRRSRSPDGYDIRCKVCCRAYEASPSGRARKEKYSMSEVNRERKRAYAVSRLAVETPEAREHRLARARANSGRRWAEDAAYRAAQNTQKRARLAACPIAAEARNAQVRAWKKANRKKVKAQERRRKHRQKGIECSPYSPVDIFTRDGWECHLCGGFTDPAEIGALHPRAPTLDHVTPTSKGGPDTPGNVRCACRLCNSLRGNSPVAEFQARMFLST